MLIHVLTRYIYMYAPPLGFSEMVADLPLVEAVGDGPCNADYRNHKTIRCLGRVTDETNNHPFLL